MKKAIVLALLAAAVFTVTGCAKKSPSEQLAEDAKRAANQMNKDVKNLFK